MDNEIRHYGVMGMKWGKGKGIGPKAWAKERVKGSLHGVKNIVTHPVLSTVGTVKSIPKNKLATAMTFASSGTLMTNKQIKDINNATDALIAKKKAQKVLTKQGNVKLKDI